MSCHGCKDYSNSNCTDITTSSCVSWQGDTAEDLKICLNDSLTYVGNVILAKVKDLLKGKGIILEDLYLDDNDLIDEILGNEEKSLLNVLDAYKQAIGNITEVSELTAENVAEFADVAQYTLGCLGSTDNCGDPMTFKSLLQAIITKLCGLDSQFENIGESLLTVVEEIVGNFLLGGAVNSSGGNGIKYSGIGANTKVILEAMVPPYVPVIYTGSTAMFDAKGVGLPNTAYQGWYLCNGANGTPNSTTLPQNAGNNIQYIIRFN